MPKTFRQILALPGVRRLWLAQLVSIAGDFLALFAVVGLASFRIHSTAAQITGVTISYMLPLAIFGPVAGVFIDRWHPRRAMVGSDLMRAGLVLLLMFATQLWVIYAILFALSTVSTFFIPAQSVTVRTLVPRESLLTVNTLMQQTILAMRLISPAAAGLLVSRFGPGSCFFLDTFSFVFSAVMLSGLALETRPRSLRPASIARDLWSGSCFILTQPAISFVMMAIAAATFAISCFSPLIVVLLRDILRADVRSFGLVSAMIGLGMIAGTQTVRKVRMAPREMVTMSLGVIAGGIGIMGASTVVYATALGALVTGAGVGLLMAPAQTLIQSETPLAMAGRVSSGVMALVSSAQILGLILSGSCAAAVGIRPLFFGSAAMLGALAAGGFRKMGQGVSSAIQTSAAQTR